MVGLVAPHVFAETDNDIILFTDPDGWYTIELPNDGWFRADTKDHLFLAPNAESMIRITGYTLLEDLDLTDSDILNEIQQKNRWYCSKQVYDDIIYEWAGCYKFQKIDTEITYTNEGRKLWMMDMIYTMYGKVHAGKIYSIEAYIFDGRWSYQEITTRTVIDGTNADPETLQQIKEIIKSIVVLDPHTEPELKPEPELQTSIPGWIKNNVGWWATDQIDDSSFLQGISYLIQNNIIVVPSQDVSSESSGTIPDWVKNNAGWWATDQIGDEEFINAIQHLIQKGIIQV